MDPGSSPKPNQNIMKKILIIEDNQDVRENTGEILELANFEVIMAENGKRGVELAKKELPDLIICDIMMPELDGYGVLRMLSKDTSTAAIPFIFLTAKAEKEDIRKGMGMGADDYLTKPFDDMELLDAIEVRLKKNELIKSEFKKDSEGLNEFIETAKSLADLNLLTTNPKRTTTIPKKQIVFNEGSYPNFIFFLNKGKIKTSKFDRLGNEFITGLYKDGDFFGFIDVLENTNYSETAESLEDSEIVQIPRDEFNALLFENRDIANKFIKLLSNNISEKEERLLKLAYNSVRKRVADALILLQDKYKDENEKEPFTIAMQRDNLSAIVGSSKETVIRMLSDFKDEGLIQIAGRNITIMNYDKLKGLKN
jgi:CRP/FNR family transcriptional regulator, polysaccharide utilization system transcription regulator